MQTFTKILNATGMLAGCLAAFVGFKLLLNHQKAVYSVRIHHWIPTVVILLIGAWLFFVGLVGFMRSKARA